MEERCGLCDPRPRNTGREISSHFKKCVNGQNSLKKKGAASRGGEFPVTGNSQVETILSEVLKKESPFGWEFTPEDA